MATTFADAVDKAAEALAAARNERNPRTRCHLVDVGRAYTELATIVDRHDSITLNGQGRR